MRDNDKRKNPNNNQTKRRGAPEKRDRKQVQKPPNRKVLDAKQLDSNVLVNDSNMGSEPGEVYENVVIDYVDDVKRLEQVSQDKHGGLDGNSSDLEKEEDSDSETIKDSVSSHGGSVGGEDEKVERNSKVCKSSVNNYSPEIRSHGSLAGSDRETVSSHLKVKNNTPKKPTTSNEVPSRLNAKGPVDKNSEDMNAPPKALSESSEGLNDKAIEDVKDVVEESSNGTQSVSSDNETIDALENGEHEDDPALTQKIEEMEMRIEKLEEELREVAALEISLYSVVPEHGSSAHKVHTPARRLSRLYIHGCKYYTQDKRATTAKNTVSGLVLIAKSCGNDVPRLTFWLSNTIVLREIISQAFGSSCHSSSLSLFTDSNGSSKRNEGKPAVMKWKGSFGGKQMNGFMHFEEDWQETGIFTAALEKVESWIFSRIVESVWWQALAPHMQSPRETLSSNKSMERLLGPALGDQQQGSFSINLWRNAFQDALQRLCPVRAGGHECGCLPIIGRMVMEQCVARLDVAMFNAILRESANEIPTDPVSDPILDPNVLPIPAGDLSFGSGAQLKNSVGNWSRWLTDMFGMDSDDFAKEDSHNSDDDDRQDGHPKSFNLLNELSDLLMLPKDMLMDRSIRLEVCPSISLPLVKRILCNFTPDEFCPDAVPGPVLEALNAESFVERRVSGESARNFPYSAAPVAYKPPSSADVTERVTEVGEKFQSQLSRNASTVQRKGYTSDEELEELDSSLTSIIEKLPLSPAVVANGNGKHKQQKRSNVTNARYELLREVWSA